MVTPDMLMAAPRGLRMLLAYALESERLTNPEYDEDSLVYKVSHASYALDPGRVVSRVMFVVGEGDPDFAPVPVEDVVERLREVPLADVMPELLRVVLASAVDNARYWQEPDGEDVLAATAPMRAALGRVAEHIVRSPYAEGWSAGMERGEQWRIQWEGAEEVDCADAVLTKWRERMIADEARAQRERPSDPTANWSGEWWSIPPTSLPRTTRALSDGTPAGLWFVEDNMGFQRAFARRVRLPPGARVFEINSGEAWAELCRRCPLDVSAGKRHDWYRTTGRVGTWVMPTRSLVATVFDAVHLTVAAYLAAAGAVIDVDDGTASVIAGWNPDEAWWFLDPNLSDETAKWIFVRDDDSFTWSRDQS